MSEELKRSAEQQPAPESGPASATPTVPEQPAPKKPIRTIWIAAYGLIGLAALGLISNIGNLHSQFTAAMPKSPYTAKPSTVTHDAVTSFQQQEQEQIRKLEQENAEAQRTAQKAAEAAKAVGNTAAPTMMPCTPALAGTQGTSSTGSPITCGSDGQWHPSAEANGIPPMSAAQQRALYGSDSAGSARENPAQVEKRRREEALNSSSVAVDFTAASITAADRQNGLDKSGSDAGGTSTPEQDQVTSRPIGLKTSTAQTDLNKPKYDWDRYSGKLYRIFEGTVLESVLTNRINGAFAGPIDAMLTTDVWSHDRQQLLIPQGTRCLGTVSAVNGTGQQRLFVAFHRCIMPDGYSLDLDKFPGLNEIGETGLRDLVNHHYFQIFGASLAIGAVGGLAQIGSGYSGFGYDPSTAIRNGVSQEMAQESMQILDRFLNQLPTFIVRERSRVRIYLSGDLEVPAYNAHQVDPAL
jgi:type IV secretory pathway VirB10-like protein